MKEIYTKYYENLFDLLKIPEKIKNEIQIITNEVFIAQNDFNTENTRKFQEKNTIISQIISNNFAKINNTNLDFFKNSITDVYKYVENIENVVFQAQIKDRFYSLPSDKLTTKITKKIKLILQYIMWLPLIITNLFRKKSNKKELKYKRHKVKKSKIAELVFVNYFLRKKHVLLVRTLDKRQELLLIIKEIDEIFKKTNLTKQQNSKELITKKFDEFNTELEEHKNLLTNNFNRTFNDLNEKYESLCLKFGTFEFPNRKIKKNKIARRTQKLLKNQTTIFNNYEHITYGLFEHWRLKHNVHEFLYDIIYSFDKGSNDFIDNTKTIQKSCNIVITAISEVVTDLQIKNIDTNKLIDEKIEGKILKTVIPAYISQTSKTKLTNSYDLISNEIINNYNKLELNYKLPKIPNYRLPIPQKHLKTINIEHILQEIFEKYIQIQLLEKKNIATSIIQKKINTIDDIGHIIDYAIEFYQNQNDIHENLRFKEFFNGVKRALSKTKKCDKDLTTFKTETIKYFNNITSDFNNEILEQTSPQKLFIAEKNRIKKLKIRNLKRKFFFLFNVAKIFVKETIIVLKKIHKKFNHEYFKIRKFLGINPDEVQITGELSNYLSDTKKSIANLPLMYQKLFATRPLKNDRFYVPADKVLSELNNAYSNWQESNIASTCLIGESGSGMTTTINYFIRNTKFDYPVETYNVSKTTITEDDFIIFLKTIFKDYNFKNLHQLIAKINNKKHKKIIIIENIQQLFMRIRGGFSNLNLLFQLISQTNSIIFWINTCSLYSWKFINYAINSEDHYRYIINMNFETKGKIQEIIESRHKPSGFNLIYKEPALFWKSRKYKKLNDENKQKFLQNDFFKKLNKFSQDNISMALIFWQRSVIKIENDHFYMQYKKIDHSFLSTLSIQKIKTLHSIIIQRNLSTKEHQNIFELSETESFMQLNTLKNDAIIVEKNNRYSINPLLYRQVVDYLKSSNFIY